MQLKLNYTVKTVFCIFLALVRFQTADASPDERNLLSQLLDKYNTLERPVANNSDALIIKIGFSLRAIDNLSIQQQRVKTVGSLKLEWTDVNLKWNATEHGNLKRLHMPPNRIWEPDIYLRNEGSGYLDVTYTSHLVVNNDGLVQYNPSGKFDTFCDLTAKNYPFDQHQCEIEFASWSHAIENIDLEPLSKDSADKTNYIPNPYWEVLGFEAIKVLNSKNPEDNIIQPVVSFSLTVRRKGEQTFVQNKLAAIILTCLLLSSRLLTKSLFRIPFVLVTLAVSIKFWKDVPEEGLQGLGNYFETFTRLCVVFLVIDIVVEFIQTRSWNLPPFIQNWSERARNLAWFKLFPSAISGRRVDAGGQVDGINLTEIDGCNQTGTDTSDSGVFVGLLNVIISIILVLSVLILYASYFCF